MPLPAGDLWDLDEQPLSSSVLEAGLDDTELHGTTGVNENLRQSGRTSCPVLSEHPFTEIGETGPDCEPPAHISKAVLGRVEGEGCDVVGIGGVTDEATSSMAVETKHEEERKVMSVPEGFKALGTDLVMGGRVHEEHDQEHEVTSDGSRLGVVDLKCDLLANLGSLDIDEVDIMSSGVHHGPESHGVGDLTMEPDVLIGGEQPSQLGSYDLDDITQHGYEDHKPIECEDKSSTTGRPHRPFETVECGEFEIGGLTVPSICEEEEVQAVPDNVEGKPSWCEELPLKPALTHGVL